MARRRFTALLLPALFLLAPAWAEEPPRTISEINVIRWNVFDSKDGAEPLMLHRIPNALHIVTREGYIRRELLFKEGDVYDPALVAESERMLRSRPFFRAVSISTSAAADGNVAVTVETDDVWTTSLQVAFGVAGGETFYRLGILEHNFLGRGKRVGAFVRQDIDRFVRGMSYEDSQFLGTRWTSRLGYGRDEKGEEYEVGLEKPYYATSVAHSEGGLFRRLDDEDRLFEDGEEAARFDHRTIDGRTFGSYALTRSQSRIRRIGLAYERQEDQFRNLVASRDAGAVPLEDRVISAALLSFDHRNLDFRTHRGITTFDRLEDANHGWEWFVEVGPSLKSFGATRDGAFGRLQIGKVMGHDDIFLWFNHLDIDGRLESGQVRDGVSRLRTEAFLPEWRENHTASLRAEWIASRNLDPESQFLLGGANGLRAYKVREESGANSLLVTIENRRHVVHDWMKLLSVGWAVFADAGTAWDRGSALHADRIKSDVGIGLRFSPSRSVDPGILRADLAYALQDNDSSSRLAVNIGADIHFGEARLRKFDQ